MTNLSAHRKDVPTYKLVNCTPDQPIYLDAQKLIERQYKRCFGAGGEHNYPQLAVLTANQQAVACVGYRAAAAEPLFSEQYLDQPVETQISALLNRPVSRTHCLEIGGLALGSRSLALPFMVQLAPFFADLGFEIAVCTVTDPVRACLNQLGIASLFLADATATRLQGKSSIWGKYYDLNPVVLAGEIRPAIEKMTPFLLAQ